MDDDKILPAEDEGRISQARRLAEKALDAERSGDEATADRLFAEAERIDPSAAADVLEEGEITAAVWRRRHGRRLRAGRLQEARF